MTLDVPMMKQNYKLFNKVCGRRASVEERERCCCKTVNFSVEHNALLRDSENWILTEREKTEGVQDKILISYIILLQETQLCTVLYQCSIPYISQLFFILIFHNTYH